MLYLPCDEIFDARELGETIRSFLETVPSGPFLLIVDEVTFVKNWDRVIKALADEGVFRRGICLLTGSDTVILKEAAMRFPGRRGKASMWMRCASADGGTTLTIGVGDAVGRDQGKRRSGKQLLP